MLIILCTIASMALGFLTLGIPVIIKKLDKWADEFKFKAKNQKNAIKERKIVKEFLNEPKKDKEKEKKKK